MGTPAIYAAAAAAAAASAAVAARAAAPPSAAPVPESDPQAAQPIASQQTPASSHQSLASSTGESGRVGSPVPANTPSSPRPSVVKEPHSPGRAAAAPPLASVSPKTAGAIAASPLRCPNTSDSAPL